MACKAVKKLLGYELCLMEPEGTLFYSDSIAVIRKTEYTEIFNLETMQHEIGDKFRGKLLEEQYISISKTIERILVSIDILILCGGLSCI